LAPCDATSSILVFAVRVAERPWKTTGRGDFAKKLLSSESDRVIDQFTEQSQEFLPFATCTVSRIHAACACFVENDSCIERGMDRVTVPSNVTQSLYRIGKNVKRCPESLALYAAARFRDKRVLQEPQQHIPFGTSFLQDAGKSFQNYLLRPPFFLEIAIDLAGMAPLSYASLFRQHLISENLTAQQEATER
jgi:hypothetical protein